MKRKIQWSACVATALVLCGSRASTAFAALNASATLTSQPVGPNYQYTFTLHNTGDTDIGTYWFAWIPNYDFLRSPPTIPADAQPAGWTGAAVQDGYLGGYSIEWSATTPLPPGQTASGFTFTSADAPSLINGVGNIGLPVETSYVYIGASQTDPGLLFQTTTAITPEPALALLLPGLFLVARRRRATSSGK